MKIFLIIMSLVLGCGAKPAEAKPKPKPKPQLKLETADEIVFWEEVYVACMTSGRSYFCLADSDTAIKVRRRRVRVGVK